MTAMLEFNVAMLGAVSTFLASEPVIYLFGMVIFCVLIRAVRSFFP